MKDFCLLLICMLFSSLSLSAQDKELEKYAPEVQEISSPDFEWGQFDSKKARCRFKKNALELECRVNGDYACTYTELELDPINVDFILSFQMEVDKLDDNHCFGIVFDYKNLKNFKALCFGKKQFAVVTYEDGDRAIVKEGLYKLDNKKEPMITLKKKGKRLDFYVGNQYLSLTTLKNCEITSPSIGFYVENVTKISATGLGYRVILHNEEETE